MLSSELWFNGTHLCLLTWLQSFRDVLKLFTDSQSSCTVKKSNAMGAEDNIICLSGRSVLALTGNCSETLHAENKHLSLSPDASEYMKQGFLHKLRTGLWIYSWSHPKYNIDERQMQWIQHGWKALHLWLWLRIQKLFILHCIFQSITVTEKATSFMVHMVDMLRQRMFVIQIV